MPQQYSIPSKWITPLGAIAAFSIYFCTYAFRKPFAVGTFEGLTYWGIDYKIILVISQLIGYTLSKFLGISVVPSITRQQRPWLILAFIGFAELALLGFGLTQHFLFLFLNGLPLGMIWGFVFAYLEGRRVTEILAIGQASSFIVSSGVVKSVGKYLMDSYGISEFWMPFLTGALFFLPLVGFLILLHRLPPPDARDVAARTERIPMNRSDRWQVLKRFAPGIILIMVAIILLTVYRDIRDNFAIELLTEIGYGESASNLAKSEIWIAAIVLISFGLVVLIKNNRYAVMTIYGFMALGCLLVGLSTWLYEQGQLNPYTWYTLIGLGLFYAYIPYHGILFDRLIALFKNKSNAGYLIYVSDALGYLGSMVVLLYKNFGMAVDNWMSFFVPLSYAIAFLGAICLIGAAAYFYWKELVDKASYGGSANTSITTS